MPELQGEQGDPRIAFAVKLGQALHTYGIPTHRLEEAMNLVLKRLGLEGQFFSTPTGIFASFGLPEEHRTSLIRVGPSEVDLEKQSLLDELTGRIIRGEITATQGIAQLEAIVAAPPRYGPLLTVLSFGIASCAASRFFGGGWREALASAIIGVVIGIFAIVVGRSEDASRVFEPVASILAAALAVISASLLFPLSLYITTLAGLIVLVPGLTVTTAMRELATKNLVSGTARLTGAALIFFEMGFGAALGWQLSRLLPAANMNTAPIPLPGWTLAVALLMAPLGFAVLLRARPADIGWIVLASLVSFCGSRLGALILGPELGVCVGAILVGAGSNLYARLVNRPAAIALVPGILLLVPGSVGFGSLAKFIARDVLSGVETAFSMLLVAVAIVTGLLVSNLIVPPRRTP
jgi:uncharacterized membrane protein YjjP (DUF1212 family)